MSVMGTTSVREAGRTDFHAEEQRLREAYEQRAGLDHHYSFFAPPNLFRVHQLERDLLRIVSDHGLNDLREKRILDIGCGTGGWLRQFIRWGADPGLMAGIDLLPDRIDAAKRLSPAGVELRVGNAAQLPYSSSSFDLVVQFTVLTSILEPHLRAAVATEMLRVVKPSGAIIWYDLRVGNPRNRDVVGIGRSEIKNLFSNCNIDLRSITLAPPIARSFARRSWALCYCLERLPFLRTHYLGLIRKRDAGSVA